MIVVADTGPINYLIAIKHIELLPRLYVRILVPSSVRDELQRDAAPKLVRQWIARPPEWLEDSHADNSPQCGTAAHPHRFR